MISGSDGELGGCQRSLARINQMPLAELSGAFCAKTWQIRMIVAAAGWGEEKYTAAVRHSSV